jgi:hypothetical protein
MTTTMSDDEYFLFVCEKVWRLSEEERAFPTQADQGSLDAPTKRRALMVRIREMTRPLAIGRDAAPTTAGRVIHSISAD